MQFRAGQIVVTGVNQHSWKSRWVAKAIGTPWTHVFLVISETELIEAWFPLGVRRVSLAERLAELREEGQAFEVRDPDAFYGQQHLREAVVAAACEMEGYRYHITQAVLLGLFGRIRTSPQRIICSRFITETFEKAGVNLFPALRTLGRVGRQHPRLQQILTGWVLPHELLWYSATVPVWGESAKQV